MAASKPERDLEAKVSMATVYTHRLNALPSISEISVYYLATPLLCEL